MAMIGELRSAPIRISTYFLAQTHANATEGSRRRFHGGLELHGIHRSPPMRKYRGKELSMETLDRIIAEHPFFGGLNDAQVHLLAGCASNTRFRAGEPLFLEGGEANQFFLIREGKVALEVHTGTDTPIVVQCLSAGDVVGWSWLIPPHRWRFDARAVEETRAFALDGACLRRKCEEDHDLGYELLKRFSATMAERLQATRRQLLDVYHAYHSIVEART